MALARFLQTCVNTPADEVDDLYAMIDGADTISRRTFLKHVDRDELRREEQRLGYGRGLPMSRDWHITYHRSTWKGRPAYFFCWSAIEHIFIGYLLTVV